MPVLSWRRPKDPYQYLRDNPGMKWTPYIPLPLGPIQYLEIGVHKAINVVDVLKSYAAHPESVVHCVDPWMDYDAYPEYKGEIQSIYHTAMRAIEKTGQAHKCKIYRDLSDNVIPTFPDNYFDIIFIDGSHETEYVYRDGVMSIEKVKPGGYLIFDDYTGAWPQTIAGIDKFLDEYKDRLGPHTVSPIYGQVFVRKL